jgi:hypothetical protein
MKEVLFTETPSIGLREQAVMKHMLKREMVVIPTRYGDVEVKRSYLNGRVVNEKPEFEHCRILAREHGVPLDEVVKEVMKQLYG